MEKIKSDSANLVFTSPPYNMNLRIRNGKHCSRQITKELTTKYKNFNDNLTMDEYLEFNEKVIDELLRISPVVFYNVQFLTGNKIALFKLIGKYSDKLKEIIIWDKVNSEPAIGEGILNSQYETILVFDRLNAISRKFDNGSFKRGTLSNHWSIKKDKSKTTDHKAVFPIELASKIILNFSNKGDTVLDPFMGTGTTGIASKASGRNYIGIEIDSEYFEISKQRINGLLL